MANPPNNDHAAIAAIARPYRCTCGEPNCPDLVEMGPRYVISTHVNDEVISVQQIEDPFIVNTTVVPFRDLLRALFTRREVQVVIRVNADRATIRETAFLRQRGIPYDEPDQAADERAQADPWADDEKDAL
jgi:hypothetical protein